MKRKLSERELAVKHLIETGIEDGYGDYDRIIGEHGWNEDFSQYLINTDAGIFSEFWVALEDIFGGSFLDVDYDSTIMLLSRGDMWLDLEKLLWKFGGVSKIWAKTERNLIR